MAGKTENARRRLVRTAMLLAMVSGALFLLVCMLLVRSALIRSNTSHALSVAETIRSMLEPNTRSGRLRGVPQMQDRLDQLISGRAGIVHVFISDKAGRILYHASHKDHRARSVPPELPIVDAWPDNLSNPVAFRNGIYESALLISDGKRSLGAIYVGFSGAFVNGEMLPIVLWGGGAIVVMVLLAGLVAARLSHVTISGPVGMLVGQISCVNAGNGESMNMTVDPPGPEEYQRLCEVLNELFERIHRNSADLNARCKKLEEEVLARSRAENELQQHGEQLEELVDMRTGQLRDAQGDVVKNERLAMLGRVTATVSHEVRNPLSTIRSSLYTLRQLIEEPSEHIDQVLERAERNIVRCDRIIEELLDYTRQRQLDMELTNVDEWLAEVFDDIDIPRQIELIRSFDCGRYVPMARDYVRRCVINVADNASHAMTFADDPERMELRVSTFVRGEGVAIEFADRGPGIPPQQISKVFEPLYSTKGFGVGLGIPIVKQIAERHGGRFELASAEGEGTQATIWLPFGDPES